MKMIEMSTSGLIISFLSNLSIKCRFLNVNGQKFVIPGMNERDTTGSKIEALRTYLDKEIGREFVDAYKAICNEKDDDYS